MSTWLDHLDKEDTEALCRVMGSLAEDAWDERTLCDHALRTSPDANNPHTPDVMRLERTLDLLAHILHFEEHSDGSYTRNEFLDMTGYFWGTSHMQYLKLIREWLHEHAPDRDEHDYARARHHRRAYPERGRKVVGA